MKKTRRQLLGQHFLHNRGILDKIVRAVDPGPADLVVEIGPGRGALTFPLAERAGRVTAVERDGCLVAALRELAPPNLEIIEADALGVSFRDLAARRPAESGRALLAGNLPYAISSPLLFKVLEDSGLFARCVFLVQKEFAQRVCARAGTKLFAPLSILIQNHFETRILFTVSPASFSPPPRVDSALVRLEKRPEPVLNLPNETAFEHYLQAAFRQRRKTLWNNLAARGAAGPDLEAAFAGLKLDTRLRAEALPAEGHAALFNALIPVFPT
jgi:16S rRNA (adenine1518-N6/adenine1519-N6)-dimethyltransferase